jgi:outer membrane protein assembly factor BamB
VRRERGSRLGTCAAALALCLALVAAVVPGGSAAAAAGDVTTEGYNTLRDNWDAAEPALAPSAVTSPSFGRLFSTQLVGAVYAQPLLVAGKVIVTTEQANAYAVNATSGAIEWSRSFGTPVRAATIGCSDLVPYLGSTSTPVIDPATGTIYLTTRLQTGQGLSGAHWYLQALSATTGKEVAGFPVEINGTPANTPGVPFNESFAMQRPGLLLLNGSVYAAFASNCDITPYRGIVAAFNARTGALTSMWSDESGVGTDENSEAGIWQSGAGLVSDAPRRIILASGNGVSPQPAPSNSPPATLSESVMALSVGTGGKLTPTQFFSPSNAPTLDQNDEDLGSGGPIALPGEFFGTTAHPRLVVEIGKDGRVFLLDSEDMGGFRQGPGRSDAVLQKLGPFNGVWGHPAAYGGEGGWVYVLESAGGGFLRALKYGLNGEGVPRLASAGTSSESFGYTSGSPLVTSSGTTPGSAVVWVVYVNGPGGGGAQLRAYAALPTSGTLALLRALPIGSASKFSVATAAAGRVYVGTRNGRLLAFGSSAAAPVQAPPLDAGSVSVGQSRTLTLPLAAAHNLTITGPVTVSGEEAAPATPARTAAHAARGPTPSAGVRRSPGRAPKRRKPRSSGTVRVAAGVFSVQQPPAGTALAAGATLSLQVTFTPAHPGPVVGLLSIPTSAGTETVSISGYGSAPGLLVSPAVLDFGSIETNAGGRSLSFTISNSGERPETITGYGEPGLPYALSGLPPIGTALAPQQAVTASVAFDPASAGSFPSALQVSTDAGAVALPLSGAAVTGVARLAVSRTVDAGTVPLGQSRTVTFDVGNTGTVPLTITRAIAPIGAFSSQVPMPEGIIIPPETFLHQTITFRPTRAGPASGVYRFNSNSGQGPVTVTLTGTGVGSARRR